MLNPFAAPIRGDLQEQTKGRKRGKRLSYQPASEVFLVLHDEKVGSDRRHASLPPLPHPSTTTKGGRARSKSAVGVTGERGDSNGYVNARARLKQLAEPSTQNEQKPRPAAHRATSTSAKRDLPPVPSKDPRNSRSPKSPLKSKPPNRSRFSKLLPSLPQDVVSSVKSSSTRSSPSKIDRSKMDDTIRQKTGSSQRSNRNTLPPTPEDLKFAKESDGKSMKTVSDIQEEPDDGQVPNTLPANREAYSLMKRLVDGRTRRFSFSRRRTSSKRDSDATLSSRFRPRLPRLAISAIAGRAPNSGIPSATTSVYSIVIQPGTPMSTRSPLVEVSKGTTTHVTEDELPERIKRIMKSRGGDLGGLSRSHASSSPIREESYHSDLTLTLGMLRTGNRGDSRGRA